MGLHGLRCGHIAGALDVGRLAAAVARGVESAPYVLAVCDGGYTTNLPLADVTGGKAWVAVRYAGTTLAPEHGGPARLLVPHLYFWKSAKWVRQLRLMEEDTNACPRRPGVARPPCGPCG